MPQLFVGCERGITRGRIVGGSFAVSHTNSTLIGRHLPDLGFGTLFVSHGQTIGSPDACLWTYDYEYTIYIHCGRFLKAYHIASDIQPVGAATMIPTLPHSPTPFSLCKNHWGRTPRNPGKASASTRSKDDPGPSSLQACSVCLHVLAKFFTWCPVWPRTADYCSLSLSIRHFYRYRAISMAGTPVRSHRAIRTAGIFGNGIRKMSCTSSFSLEVPLVLLIAGVGPPSTDEPQVKGARRSIIPQSEGNLVGYRRWVFFKPYAMLAIMSLLWDPSIVSGKCQLPTLA